jgi:ADP-heptose:LPS heptosyltransferase
VIKCCDQIDEIISYDTFLKLGEKERASFLKEQNADAIIHIFPRKDIAAAAKKAGIPFRVGTTNRLYHWTTCNKLVALGRKNSDLHEAQLNAKLLGPFGYDELLSTDAVPSLYHFNNVQELPRKFNSLLSNEKFKLILHPHSHSSGREWKRENYTELIRFLSPQKYQIIITGGPKEAEELVEWSKTLPLHVINLAGLLSLDEMISLINSCDGIVAASTGPLHIGAALGKKAIGIFPPIRPMHPGRWAPLGTNASYLVNNKICSECRTQPEKCVCINDVTADMVVEGLGSRVEGRMKKE